MNCDQVLEPRCDLLGELCEGMRPRVVGRVDGLEDTSPPSPAPVGSPGSVDTHDHDRSTAAQPQESGPGRQRCGLAEEAHPGTPSSKVAIAHNRHNTALVDGRLEAADDPGRGGLDRDAETLSMGHEEIEQAARGQHLRHRGDCLLYTSDAADDLLCVD